MIGRLTHKTALLLTLALPLAACEGLTDPSAGGQTTVVLRRGATASAALSPSYSAAVSEALGAALAGPVGLGDVQSIEISVTQVQALPVTADSVAADTASEGRGGWRTLDVSAASKINLLALPTAAESGLTLARGELAPGVYRNLRILYDTATITFAKDVTAGGGPAAKTYKAGEPYRLEIGGGKIKIPTGGFTVGAEAGETVVVTFDAAASVRKVIVTPNAVRMTPVLTGAKKGDD